MASHRNLPGTAAATTIFVVLLHWVSQSGPVAFAGDLNSKPREFITEQHPVINIGEDCSSSDTACEYLRPLEFVEIHDIYKNEINIICQRHGKRINMVGHLECAEDVHGKFCRQDRSGSLDTSTKRDNLNLPRSFSFKWVRKTGGNTFMAAFRRLHEEGAYPQFNYTFIFGFNEMDATYFEADKLMKEIETEQKGKKENKGDGHPLLAVVRNPVQRFVSAAAMLLTGRNGGYRSICKGGGREALECFLNLMERGHLDEHTAPMLSDIYCNTLGHDVQYSLYNMNVVPRLLDSLGFDGEKKINKGNPGFSVSDLDDDMIERICIYYEMDVVMMDSLGFDIPECKSNAYARSSTRGKV